MGRFGNLTAQFYAPSDLSTPLSDGSSSSRQPVAGWASDYDSALGEASLTFINDSGLNTMAAVGNICWSYKSDSLRTDLSPNQVTFTEPFIIRNRTAGPEPNQLTISGPSLLAETQRYTIYRPLGNQVTTNTTLSVAIAAPETGRTLEVGAPKGNDTMQVTTASDADVGKEIRINLDDGSVFKTIVTNYVWWLDNDHLQFRDRITANASAGNSFTLYERRVKPASPASFKQGCEVTVTLNSGSHITLVDEAAGEDGYVTLRDGVTGAANSGNAIQSRDFSAKSTSDVTQVIAYATGWSANFQTGTGTQAGTRYPGGGETVYDILRSIAEETGELFRLRSAELSPQGPKRQIAWRHTPDAAGAGGTLRLVMPDTQSSMNTDQASRHRAILLERPAHAGDYDPVTQLIPVAGDARITLHSCTAAAVSAAATDGFTVTTTGLGLYAAPYVVNDALNTAIGVYQRKVTFSEVTVEGDNVASIQEAADRLLKLSINYLKEHVETAKVITAKCISPIGIRPGQTVELYYVSPTDEYTIDYTGSSVLYVQSVRREISNDGEYPGAPISTLELTPTRRPSSLMASSPAREVGRRLAAVDRLAAKVGAPQLISSAVFVGSGGGVPSDPVTPGAYLPLSGGTMTGNIAFSGSQTVDGVDISAHAANANAHHNAVTVGNTGLSLSTQQISLNLKASEPGLEIASGVGVLLKSSNPGLELSGGLGVFVNTTGGVEISSGVRVKLPANSGLTRDSTGIYLSPSSLTVSSTNAVSGSGHTHAITTSANTIGAGSAAILASGSSGELALERLGVGIATSTDAALVVRSRAVDDYTIWMRQLASQTADMWRVENSSGNPLIRLTGGGNLESGTPAYVSGMTGWRIESTGNAEFNNVFVRGELHATTFVADEMHATGGTLAVMTATKVAAPAGAGTNQLPASVGSTFYANFDNSWDTGLSYLSINDVIRIKTMGEVASGGSLDLWDMYFQVVAAPGSSVGRDLSNGKPGYRPVQLRWLSGGEANLVIPTGSAAVKWGRISGSGGTYTGGIILTSDLQYNPYIDIFTVPADQNSASWQSAIPTPTPRVRLGNLRGVLGKSADEWGMAAGTDLSDATVAARYIVASDAGLALRNVDLKLYSGSTPVVEMTQNGVVRFGTDIGADATTSFWHNSATGALRVGNLTSGKGNLYWDGTHLKLRMHTTDLITLDGGTGDAYFSGVIGIGASGGIYQGTGTFGTPTTGLKIWRDSGVGRLATYSSGTVQVYFDTSGKLLAGGGKVTMDSTGIQINGRDVSSVYEDVSGTDQRITFKNASGSTTVGYVAGTRYTSGAANGVRIAADSTNYIHIYDVLNHEWKTGSGSGIQLRPGSPGVKIYSGDLDVEGGLKLGYTGSINYGQFVSDMQSGTYNAFILLDTVSVAHGMTSLANTAAYGTIGKINSSDGGLDITGYTETTRALQLEGIATNDSTSKTNDSLGAVVINAAKKSGTGVTALQSDGNLVVIRSNDSHTRFIFDVEGDFHADSSSTTFDDHDDVALVRAADLALAGHDIDREFGDWLRYNRADLERLGLVSEGGFLNITRMQRLVMGALWQLDRRINALETA